MTRIRIWATTATTGGALTAATFLLGRAALRQWHLVAGPSPARLDEAVTLLSTAVALVLCLWLATSTVVSLLAHLPGRLGERAGGLAQVVAPALTRRVAAVLVGAAIGGALAPGVVATAASAAGTSTSASAAAVMANPGRESRQPPPSTGPGFAATTGSSPPPWRAAGPGWVPSRPVVRPQPGPDLLTASPRARDASGVVVQRGDTLWDLVRDRLGPSASDAEVAEAWPRWYAANRTTIGSDPALILPGQVLHAPAPEQTDVPR